MKTKYKVFLVSILVMAAALRFIGIAPGHPPYHPDEGMSYSQALSMILEKTIDGHGYPLAYAYPNVVPLTNALAFKLFFIPLAWTKYWIGHVGDLLDGLIKLPFDKVTLRQIEVLNIYGQREINVIGWGRLVAASVGVGVVWLTYLATSKLFDKNRYVALVAAFLTAINYRQVLNSHLDLPDIYNALTLTLSFWASVNVWRTPNRKNYLLAGVLAGVAVSTKFQIFALFPLLMAHVYNSLAKKGLRAKLNFLFDRRAVGAAILVGIVVLVINPFHFIHFEKTLEYVEGVAQKYRVGRNTFDIYPYSYLYHLGIGKATSIVVLVGVVVGLARRRKETLLLLAAIIPFFYVTTYYTGGGFYTRNFVTITPLLLVFAGVAVGSLVDIGAKKIGYVLLAAALVYLGWENLRNSVVLAVSYTHDWNYTLMKAWGDGNIPAGSKVATHASTPLPEETELIPYNFDNGDFSLLEFDDLGADYVISNYDWANGSFYWWMTGNKAIYWEKPLAILERSFAGMALREIAEFAIHWEVKPWQAPDTNYVAAVVPRYEVIEKQLVTDLDYDQDSPFEDLQAIDVVGWGGYVVDYELTDNDNSRPYLFLSFYDKPEAVGDPTRRVGVRVSRRGKNADSFVGEVPSNAKFMTIGFDTFNPGTVSHLEKVMIYRAEIAKNYPVDLVKKYRINDNIIYHNSHGNL